MNATSIATPLDQHARRQVGWSPLLRTVARVLLLACGTTCLSAGVALTLWTGLGPGPLDVFYVAVNLATGLPLTFVVWGGAATLMLVATVLGRRPGIGTLLAPLMVGPTLSTIVAVLRHVPQPGLAMAVVVHIFAIGVIGIGAGALIVSGLGSGTGELLAAAAADHTGRSATITRTAIEATWLGLGLLLGGPAGIGTVLVMGSIGPSVRAGHGHVAAMVAFAKVHAPLPLRSAAEYRAS